MFKPALFFFAAALWAWAGQVDFTERTIATGLRGGYQVTIVDMNHDGKPDLLVVASGMDELLWFENPGWQRHVMARGFKGMINAAAYDTDGDGIPEVALAHGFANRADQSAGILSMLHHQGDPREEWSVREIDRLTTSHRLRWADIDGSHHKVLVNAPLMGANAAPPDFRDHVPLVYYRPGEWSRQLVGAENEGVMHGMWITDWDGRGRDEILTASFVGIHLYRFGADHAWTREEITKGDPAEWPKGGSSDVTVGRAGGARFVAAIEPWHGHEVTVYRKRGAEWAREVVDDTLGDTHSIATADLDQDGNDELVVAQRGKPGRVLVYSFARGEGRWEKKVIDEGSIAAAACAVGDLNRDRRIDVVCIGSSTANLKWYQNEPKRKDGK
jgi:hypothetical protein